MKTMIVIGMLALLLIAACSVPPVPRSQPATTPTPTVPSSPPKPVAESPATLPNMSSKDCEMGCAAQCDEDSDTACSQATDYNACTGSCGDTIRSQGCKGACATLVPVECGIIFRNECAKACTTQCA